MTSLSPQHSPRLGRRLAAKCSLQLSVPAEIRDLKGARLRSPPILSKNHLRPGCR